MLNSTNVPLSTEALSKRFRGKSALVEQVLSEFEEQASRDLQSLAESHKAGDAEKTASIAHGLKGAASLVSAEGLHRAVVDLEQRARLNALDGTEECFARVKKEVEDCLSFISITRAQNSEPK